MWTLGKWIPVAAIASACLVGVNACGVGTPGQVAGAGGEQGYAEAAARARARMERDLAAGAAIGEPNHDFAVKMIPQGQGAVDLSTAYLAEGRDPDLRRVARESIASEEQELGVMRGRLEALEGSGGAGGTGRDSGGDLDVQIVDALNKRYGAHPTFRANHAKGVIVEGTFVPTAQASELSRSPIFGSGKLPVIVRFSDAGGFPKVQDASPEANPHGMAIKFQLPGGQESDIVMVSFKTFPVATPEDFRDLQLAAASSRAGEPMSAQLKEFLVSHPSVGKAVATLGIPASFAEERYNGLDAFVFINRAGARQAFRYIVMPEKVVHLDAEAAAKMPADYLMSDLPERVAKGPVTFHMTAQLAAAGDQTKDPTQAWPEERPVADLGTLTLDKNVADSDTLQQKLLFTPGRLTDGIEPSDDPLIPSRDGTYAVSFQRRRSALAEAELKSEFAQALERQLAIMERDMAAAAVRHNPDHDFAAMMIPHEQAAIHVAEAYLLCGSDPALCNVAQQIVVTRGRQLAVLQQRKAAISVATDAGPGTP